MSGRTSRRPGPAFYPSVRQRRLAQLVTGFERRVKKMLFNCRMCGNCLLYETAFVCPMTCPRGIRNGPCRGSSPDHCFVDPTCDCTWFSIFQRAEQQGRLDSLLEINAPLDNHHVGCETLLTAFKLWWRRSPRPHLRDLKANRILFNSNWESFRYDLRQPTWWKGDSRYHPPAYDEPVSHLESLLRGGRFVISAEVSPPMEPTGDRIARVADCLKGFVDTANFIDNPQGVPRMSGLACSLHSLQHDMEPVLQLQTRYRSRYDVGSEVMGAAVVGVRNILCLTDDIGRLGLGPPPRPETNDLDAVQALWMLRRLRDEGVDVDGEPVERRPRYFLGAAASPYAALPRYEAIVTEKKINAGAQFLQTLPVFDLTRFAKWLDALDKRDLLGKVYLMPTVALLKSPRHARFMANEVPGIFIPSSVMDRMDDALDPLEEGIQIALTLIVGLQRMGGIHGLHILAPGQEQVVPRLVRETGLRDYYPVARVPPGNGRSQTHHRPDVDFSSSEFMDWSNPDDLSGAEHNQNLNL